MLIGSQIPQALAAGKYENVYVSVYNGEASAALPMGAAVVLDSDAAAFLGRAVTIPTTADLNLFIGVVAYGGNRNATTGAYEIHAKNWGLVCTYGVFEEAYITGGTSDLAIGDNLCVMDGSYYLFELNTTKGVGHAVAMEAFTDTSGTGRVFIRAM